MIFRGPHKTLSEKYDADKLRERIIDYLKEVDGTKIRMGCVISAAIRHQWNFEMLMDLIKQEYQSCPDGIIKCIGEVPTRLILSYNSKQL